MECQRQTICDIPANTSCREETEDDAVPGFQTPANVILDDDFD
ncbi:hypothetical protein PITC_021820 [Penicillium italicum]|uniref:Uncharacterized protein n=1 Tax=Penicillium italicum TaxID=40296 RepID=A0A0A2L269_PENIT|nr:hypothetical protein PITC_021820 [Penicillium italicum]